MRVIDNPEKFRENIKQMLLKKVSNISIANNIEKGIFNYTIKECNKRHIVKKWDNIYFTQLYTDKLRSIMINLKSPILLNKIVSKEIKAHEIAFMTHQDMRPDRWKDLLELKNERENNFYAPKIEANTDNFTCRKCNSNQCSYYQLQTRSADEPMTTFVTCISCGNRWKC